MSKPRLNDETAPAPSGPANALEYRRDGFVISTDKARLDREAIYRFLAADSYWSAGMTRRYFDRTVAGSLCFGLYDAAGRQQGFARVVTDFASLAWLSDVYVLPALRGRGLGHWLVATVMAHPPLQGLRRWMLSTRDQQALYAKFGFRPLDDSSLMTRLDGDAHKRDA